MLSSELLFDLVLCVSKYVLTMGDAIPGTVGPAALTTAVFDGRLVAKDAHLHGWKAKSAEHNLFCTTLRSERDDAGGPHPATCLPEKI